jgi:hypothetical protein
LESWQVAPGQAEAAAIFNGRLLRRTSARCAAVFARISSLTEAQITLLVVALILIIFLFVLLALFLGTFGRIGSGSRHAVQTREWND